MLRIVLGMVAGFVGWLIMWLGGERIVGAISPTGFGDHQRAFEEAVKNGGQFNGNAGFFGTHLVLLSVVSLLAGVLTALVAGGNPRAPLVLGIVLLALALAKAGMSWRYAPLWYHVMFAALPIPMTILGGKLTTVF